ncbi:MAG TPA: TetR family transcriptional regulator [Acidimicrobiales bacterium]|nr:TetR family transcriptional regulator [Acidimicrobiales bacterium]
MGRWQPDARGRLERAALELFSERGFDDTTVVAIAERAGLTERTFFRYFADKREVLFGETGATEEQLGSVVADAPAGTAPLDLVAAALAAWAPYFESRRELVQRRQAIIASTAELRERELIKLAHLGSHLAGALRDRGIVEPLASLAAEAGMAVFRVAFQQWVADPSQDLALLLKVGFESLQAVTATSGDGSRKKGNGSRKKGSDASRGSRSPG